MSGRVRFCLENEYLFPYLHSQNNVTEKYDDSFYWQGQTKIEDFYNIYLVKGKVSVKFKYIRREYREIGFFPWTYTSINYPKNVYADAKYEEKNLSSLGKCVTYMRQGVKWEKRSAYRWTLLLDKKHEKLNLNSLSQQ